MIHVHYTNLMLRTTTSPWDLRRGWYLAEIGVVLCGRFIKPMVDNHQQPSQKHHTLLTQKYQKIIKTDDVLHLLIAIVNCLKYLTTATVLLEKIKTNRCYLSMADL